MTSPQVRLKRRRRTEFTVVSDPRVDTNPCQKCNCEGLRLEEHPIPSQRNKEEHTILS